MYVPQPIPADPVLSATCSDLLEQFPEQVMDLRGLFDRIADLPPLDQTAVLRAMSRYTREAINETYRADPDALLKLIIDERLLEGTDELFDLGAGPGDLLARLAAWYPSLSMQGIDLSPGFVRKFNQRSTPNSRMRLGMIDIPSTRINTERNVSAISVLTLDRLTQPRGLIENMARCKRAQILATLLPIVPEDDNPSLQSADKKTVYTRLENRIVPGRTKEEDRDALLRLTEELWQRSVRFAEVDYEVLSSGDDQLYKLGVFYTAP